jgi:hypothetical protein
MGDAKRLQPGLKNRGAKIPSGRREPYFHEAADGSKRRIRGVDFAALMSHVVHRAHLFAGDAPI